MRAVLLNEPGRAILELVDGRWSVQEEAPQAPRTSSMKASGRAGRRSMRARIGQNFLEGRSGRWNLKQITGPPVPFNLLTRGSVFTAAPFASLFSSRGRLALCPGRLALVSVLQYAEGLADRQAADAVRGRIDWQYVLGLELTDPGFVRASTTVG